jgi:hypothetical protein
MSLLFAPFLTCGSCGGSLRKWSCSSRDRGWIEFLAPSGAAAAAAGGGGAGGAGGDGIMVGWK